jgi:hypothetical protein
MRSTVRTWLIMTGCMATMVGVAGIKSASATDYSITQPGTDCNPATSSLSYSTTYADIRWFDTGRTSVINSANDANGYYLVCPATSLGPTLAGSGHWVSVVDDHSSTEFTTNAVECWIENRTNSGSNRYYGTHAFSTGRDSSVPYVMTLSAPASNFGTYNYRQIMCRVPAAQGTAYSGVVAYQLVNAV